MTAKPEYEIFPEPYADLKETLSFVDENFLRAVDVETVHRLPDYAPDSVRMKIFAWTKVVLLPLWKSINEADREQEDTYVAPPAEWIPSESILTFSRRILSTRCNRCPIGMLAVDRVARFLQTSPHFQDILQAVLVVDLSDCELEDDDVPHIVSLLDLFPNCTQLDLSANHISGHCKRAVDQQLMSLFERDLLVDVCGNPLATVERNEFYSHLTEKQLRHLIWLPSVLIHTDTVSLFVKRELEDCVVTTHSGYFTVLYINPRSGCIHTTPTHEVGMKAPLHEKISVKDAADLLAVKKAKLCTSAQCRNRFPPQFFAK